MKQNKKLQSRREFFKEASEKVLPILGMALFDSTPILSSCTKDSTPSECNGCSNNCEGNSTSTTCSACSNNCENSSTSSGCSSCSDNCSDSCNTECTNDCSVNCSNSANNCSNDTISEASGSVDGREYVDLGLSVMWARCNVGASRPQAGGTFARIPYLELTGPEQDSLMISLGYYTGADQLVEFGGRTDFDVATQQWGNNWKTPSETEWKELKENCIIEAYDLRETSGIRVISRINGNSIFIPLPGAYYSNSLHDVDKKIVFHCSTYYVRYADIGGHYYDFYRSNSGQTSLGTISPMNYTSYKPSTRAVTTGSGGGSTSCNGNCTNTAQNNCSSCQVGCSNGCSQQCASNCSTGCKSTCQGTCPNGCSTLCGGACKSSCGGTCSYVSSGSSCTSGTCATTCRNYCFRTCSLACSESCMSCCITSSK